MFAQAPWVASESHKTLSTPTNVLALCQGLRVGWKGKAWSITSLAKLEICIHSSNKALPSRHAPNAARTDLGIEHNFNNSIAEKLCGWAHEFEMLEMWASVYKAVLCWVCPFLAGAFLHPETRNLILRPSIVPLYTLHIHGYPCAHRHTHVLQQLRN